MKKAKDKEKARNREYIEKILREYPVRVNVLKRYDLEIEEILLDDGIGAMTYDGDNVQTSNLSNKTQELVIRKEEKVKRLKEQQSRRRIHFDKIEIALSTFTDLQNKLIEYRYFNRYTWDMCSNKIGYSITQCKDITYDMLRTFINTYNIKPKKEEKEG